MKVQARGITHNVHVWGPEDGTPVLLIHGNCSSGAYWEPFVRALLAGGGSWRVVAPDLRGYGDTDPAPVDSTRGLRDLSDDVAALLPLVFPADVKPIVAGHSMGGGVAMHLTVDHPTAVAGLLLEAPVSPYGFGGTRDLAGTPTTDDFAGTGGGGVNPEFIARLTAKDRTGDRSESADQTDPYDDEPTITLTAAQVAAAARVDLSEDRVVAVRLSTSDGSSLWDPLPMTLPTYVNKARARRTVRTIELTGINSSGHDQADTVLAREAQESAKATKDSEVAQRKAAGA